MSQLFHLSIALKSRQFRPLRTQTSFFFSCNPTDAPSSLLISSDLSLGLMDSAASPASDSNPNATAWAGTLASSSSSSSSSAMSSSAAPSLSRYESQKRRDWNTFGQYLRNHRPPLSLPRCSGAHVLEFLRYLDQFGKTKVHTQMCPFYGHPSPPAPCPCPLKQAWGSLDALIGRLRAAYEENGGKPEANPFGARAVRLYLREVREMQAKARGISYEKKKRKKPSQPSQSSAQPQNQPHPPPPPPPAAVGPPPPRSMLS